MITPSSRLMIFVTLIEFAVSIEKAYNHDIAWLIMSVTFTLLGGFLSILFTKEGL